MERTSTHIYSITACWLWAGMILLTLWAGINQVQAAAVHQSSQQYSHTSPFPINNTAIIGLTGLGHATEDRTIIVTMAGDGSFPGGSYGCGDNILGAGTYDIDLTVRNGQTNSFLVICSRKLLGGATAPTTITVTHTDAYDRVVLVDEFSGLLSAPAVDKTASATGSSTTPSSGATATTAQADELIVGALAVPSVDTNVVDDTNTLFTGSHKHFISTKMTANMQYGNASSTGTYTYAPTLSSGSQWSAGVVTFKAVAVATATTTIGDGTTPSNKTAPVNAINNAVNAFTLVTDSGSDTLTALTVTRTGSGADADVAASGAKLWRDDGVTANEWDSTDTQIGSGASFSSGTVTFSSLSESINTSATQYLITYDITNGATVGNTLLGAATAATVTHTLVNNDTTDATLTIGGCQVVITNPTGAGSLDDCITHANGNAGTTIEFNIPLIKHPVVQKILLHCADQPWVLFDYGLLRTRNTEKKFPFHRKS